MFAPDAAPAPRARTAPAPPRVAYLTKMYPRFSETFIVNEIRAVEAIGVRVEIFSLRAPVDTRFHASLAQVTAPVHYVDRVDRPGRVWSALADLDARTGLRDLPAATLADLFAADPEDAGQAVAVAVRAHDLGVQHLHAHFGSVATTVARLAAAVLGVGYTFTAHAKDIFHESVVAADLRGKLADAREVVTVSDFNLDHLRATFGADAARVRRVYNGLDLAEFSFSAAPRRAGRICAVGRLVEKKGFGTLLDAVALLTRAGRRVHLDLVGAGPLAEDLRARAARLALGDHVTFHGPLPQDDVRALVAAAAVFAAPCVIAADGNRDGLPTVILEAMALGTPVVATPVTGIPEAVIDGVTGRLVAEHDAVALARALEEVLTDPPRARSMAAAARKTVERSFDIHTNAPQLRDVFTRAIAAGAGVRP